MNKAKRNSILYNLLIVLIFTAGLILSLYPTVSDVYGKYRDSKLITQYGNIVKDMSEDQKIELLENAVQYNAELVRDNSYIVTKFQHKSQCTEEEINKYDNLLKNSSSSIICTLSIPKIAVTLPVYHWSTDAVLEKGIGHIHGSSLPIGNGVDPTDPDFDKIPGSQALFIGHRGLPSLKLFSDLDEMAKGDMVYVKTLGDIYAYKVYAIETVLPEEVEEIKFEPGRDLITLVTCTPYGVNTHRLLVRCERVPYDGESIEADVTTKMMKTIDPKTVFGLCFIAFLVYIIFINKKKPKKQKGATNNDESENITTSNGNDSTDDL